MSTTNFNQIAKEAFLNLSERSQLEVLGASLQAHQGLDILETSAQMEFYPADKLFPLFVGLTQETFFKMLSKVNNSQLNVLKNEKIAEPIQYHLTLLIHTLTFHSDEFIQQYTKFSEKILLLEVKQLTKEALSLLKERLNELNSYCKEMILLINHALSLAWNIQRSDLIEGLNSFKEKFHRYQVVFIGSDGEHDKKEILGLFAQLQNKLHSVFGDQERPIETQALDNSDPGIEALNKLGLHYAEDYIEVGLLKENAFEDNSEISNLFERVQNELEQIGLGTVGDFKKNDIYSKTLLKEFIKA